MVLHHQSIYCNPNLGLVTKAKTCKGVDQEWSPRITFHDLESVGKCEGMDPHTPKWALTLGVGILMDSRIFKGRLQGSNSLDWRVFYTIEKFLERRYLNIPLKSSRWGIQLCFRPHFNQRSANKVMGLQSHGSPNFGNFQTPTWDSWDKMTFGCRAHGQE